MPTAFLSLTSSHVCKGLTTALASDFLTLGKTCDKLNRLYKMNPGRFARGSFRPGSFRPCFWAGSFRPY